MRRAIDIVDVSSTMTPAANAATGDNSGNQTESAQMTAGDIAADIANDADVQSSCSEVVRSNVRERLKREPEYTADKYPQTTKFINK